MSECVTRADFKVKMLPELEGLLQLSLWLTKNGRDATRLLREVMAEVYWKWDEYVAGDALRIKLHDLLTRRLLDGTAVSVCPIASLSDGNVDTTLAENNQLLPALSDDVRLQSWLSGESDEDVKYHEAIASLPEICRSAAILSYLEGFSNKEIADLAGAQPHTVESVLNMGRRFIRDELFEVLMGSDASETIDERREASG
jgi:RNA polymerase sigma-70 factor (ECF subfamily)